MKKYGLQIRFKAIAGKADQLANLLVRASSLVSTAKGCQFYVIGREGADENAVWVTEIWDSREDHANSLHTAGVKELISEAMPLLDAKPERIQELDIIGGIGMT